jgi:hypothetical protein
MDEACGKCRERRKMNRRLQWGNIKKRGHFEDLSVYGGY